MQYSENSRILMPAGEYWVGDPCYAVPNADWMEWLEAADFENEHWVLKAPVNGKEVLAFGTAYGDGCYPGSDGNLYPVDAGLIGVVPVTLNPAADQQYQAGLMHKRTFDKQFECYIDQPRHVIVLGDIRIPTDDDEQC
jgi:hypothetical protein